MTFELFAPSKWTLEKVTAWTIERGLVCLGPALGYNGRQFWFSLISLN